MKFKTKDSAKRKGENRPSDAKNEGRPANTNQKNTRRRTGKLNNHQKNQIARLEGLPHDVQRFVAHTINGTIYDTLMEATGETNRKAFKQEFFKVVLYGDPDKYYSRHSPLNEMFRQRYPTVMKFIENQKEGDYTRLACKMQSREASYMFGQVVARLAEHHPEVPVITIHDSIMTTPENVALVHRIMGEEFQRLGVSPAIRAE